MENIILILALCVYVLVPLFMTMLFKRLEIGVKFLSYVLTFILIFLYPFILFATGTFDPPPNTSKCDGGLTIALLFLNFIIGLPISMISQYIFNRMLLSNLNKTASSRTDKI